MKAAGGWAALAYAARMARQAGGPIRLIRRMRSKNACKTCALGMGGTRGGMVNEAGHFPEVCKKSLQAQAGDMHGTFSEADLARHSIERLGEMTSAQLERLGRLTFPVRAGAGDTHYRRITWDEAFDRAAAGLEESGPAQTFFYASGRSSNEAAFLLQVVARAWGCENINNCSYYCHSASGAALGRVYGSGTASVVLDDIARADLLVIAGANPASNHPRLMTQVMNLRRRGGKVIVVNPLRELGLVRFRIPSDVRSMLFGSTMSDLYLQPHVGTDIALFKAMLKGVVERGGVDDDFVASYTAGWDEVRADVEASSWDELLAVCGVARADVDRAVDLLVNAKRGVLCWAMGLTHHANGVDNILALANVALARGWLGRPGSGLLPIRGHSNVQGVGSVGVTPKLKEAFSARMAEVYGVARAAEPGWDTYRAMEAAAEGRVQAAVLLGGNLYASNPDLAWASQALRRIPLTVYLSTKWNQGHIHGRGRESIVLPVLARDEESQSTTQESMFNFVRLSEGGRPAVSGEMRSEVDIIATLAERILPPGRFDWSSLRSHRELRAGIARVVPGYEGIGAIDGDGGEFQIGGRTFHEPRFSTPDGRAHFHVTDLPGNDGADFRLMTLRSEGQFNTVVYEEEDLYRGNTRRDVVMMAAADAGRLGVGEGDRVVVESDAGVLEVCAAIVDIAPGNLAMYYPEANILVPRRIDPRSGTPAFKSVGVRLVPAARAASSR